ncbi:MULTISPECIES: tetratricopeptide repeat protein [Pedobacter]|uniref:Tetratricopeptide domain protein n=1 Tax=Pedobacter heparinus (strain ATCC 13125 / DSM 2366 / CIP 104194 / JCM 7457 / NBRC 12017 / NCIMB 9290 / NRRL B-14731 / HIM 762-3) TaxID=485917 RepID=C6XXV0_PEDHD|nr:MULTISPECIES: tetratricopeptide repeat protein [Pedobacter]ACU04368.1 Tetratricopeptide domain protein [Pedobacter heparinus DSM 2366]MBB5441056.1 tetratricopeptide (TPR) repeat protein [Pedobacter sp. AK017]
MKKVLLGILFVGVTSYANAQKSEINEAKKAWNLLAVTSGKTLADHLKVLNGGLAHTDKAIADEKSKNLPDAWSYRALFASRIALVDSVDQNNAKANQKIAEEAIAKAKSLDEKGTEKENIETASVNVENALRNRAIYAFNKKNFAGALEAFNEITAKSPNDTTMYVNAGVTAKELQNYPEVVKNFKKAIDLNYKDSKILYSEIVSITFEKMKDSVAGLNLLKEASAKYPDDSYFIGMETDLYIKKGDIAKSQEMLQKLIAKDPKNAIYQYLMGDTYYKQALEIQTKRNALDVKKTKEFNEMGAKMTKLIDQSVPYYKAALELDPKNVNALENLKIIYLFKDDKVNYEVVNKKLAELKK